MVRSAVAGMKVAELRAELGRRGLDASGRKAALVARLHEALDAGGGGAGATARGAATARKRRIAAPPASGGGDEAAAAPDKRARQGPAGRELTEQQRAIVERARRPSGGSGRGCITRVTAAAGTGKTTTLEALSRRLRGLGHRRVAYATFNRSAARDALARLERADAGAGSVGGVVDARTAHSAALACVKEKHNCGVDSDLKLGDDNEHKVLAEKLCGGDVDNLLSGVAHGTPKECVLLRRARKTVLFFIKRTLETFLHGDRAPDKGLSTQYFGTTYYPAKRWHGRQDQTRQPPHGVPPLSGKYESFYVDCASKVWKALEAATTGDAAGAGGARATFDSVMKVAQLQSLPIQASAVLVDEAQDLDACQVDWFRSQARVHGAEVYFVGDAVQSIYSFRNAKSAYLMRMKVDATLSLTNSFRFGARIAAAANTVLFAKEHSAQTDPDPDKRSWEPYRVTGVGPEGEVSAKSSLGVPGRRVTLLGRSNAALFLSAMSVLETCPPDQEVPRFAINGSGENSGLAKWRTVVKEIGHFAAVHSGSKSVVPLPDFEGETYATFEELIDDITTRELNRYGQHVSIVKHFKERTQEVVERFKRDVMSPKHKPEDADIVLSTVHAAKGMEWDNVELCDDFVELAKFEVKAVSFNGPRARFDFKSFGDDINLVYVALTRAKKHLTVPSRFLDLVRGLHDLERLRALLREDEHSGEEPDAVMVCGKPRPIGEAKVIARQVLDEVRRPPRSVGE